MVRKTDIAIFVGIPQGCKRGKKGLYNLKAISLTSYFPYILIIQLPTFKTKRSNLIIFWNY